MLEATVLALVAAGLHAGWNLVVKARGDRLAFLGAQFIIGGLMGLALLAVLGDLGAVAWRWAFLSAAIHIPYLLLLALGYRQGDFSLVYPLARGGGALLAAVGGVVLLGDHLTPPMWVAVLVIAVGLASLAAPNARSAAVTTALLLGAVIGAYTVTDARGARASLSPAYGLATFAADALGAALVLLASRRAPVALRLVRTSPWPCVGAAAAAVAAYALVLAAIRLAPVGYVTCLRESSVVLAALLGWQLLREPLGLHRVVSSTVVLGGLILLIASA
jgi:multidrug transporter EmrE-like cation transporter